MYSSNSRICLKQSRNQIYKNKRKTWCMSSKEYPGVNWISKTHLKTVVIWVLLQLMVSGFPLKKIEAAGRSTWRWPYSCSSHTGDFYQLGRSPVGFPNPSSTLLASDVYVCSLAQTISLQFFWPDGPTNAPLPWSLRHLSEKNWGGLMRSLWS